MLTATTIWMPRTVSRVRRSTLTTRSAVVLVLTPTI
jgi:hypothetical protein